MIDCASQSSLANWTLGQWADYYDDPDRDKVRNVISLEVSETTLGRMIAAPKLVRCVLARADAIRFSRPRETDAL